MGAARKKTPVSRGQQTLSARRSFEVDLCWAQLDGPMRLPKKSQWKIFKMKGVWWCRRKALKEDVSSSSIPKLVYSRVRISATSHEPRLYSFPKRKVMVFLETRQGCKTTF